MRQKLFFGLLVVFITSSLTAQQSFVINHNHTDLSLISDNWIDSAKKNLKIMYFRRSHGSHIDVGGMAALMRYSTAYAEKYKFDDSEASGSLLLKTKWLSVDFDPDIWYSETRTFLDDPANADINVVMWAWSSKFYVSNVQAYLDTMEAFISDYGINGKKIQDGTRTVPVTFIFQTACSQASNDANQVVYEQNQLIRQHCQANNRILFDFNDIETYNPDGEYFGDGNPDGSYSGLKRLDDDISYNLDDGTRGNWGIEWNNANPTSELAQLSADDICTVCEHSDQREDPDEDNSRLHCVLKGRAAWWMWAKLAGWVEKSLTIETATPLDERNINNHELNLILNGETFVDNVLNISNFELNNAPSGTTILSISYIDNTHATLILSFDGSDFDSDINNFFITINQAELSGTDSITSNSLFIDAFDEHISISPDVELTETNLDNGVITMRLTDVEFADNQPDIVSFILNNAPLGTNIESIQYQDENTATINLSFDGTDFDTDIIDFCITVAASELNCNFDITSDSISIQAVNESAPYMTLSVINDLTEDNLDGATITMNITNDSFIDNQLDANNIELLNAPTGCSVQQINYLSSTSAECVLSFDGTDFDENISNFTVKIFGAELLSNQDLTGDYLSIKSIVENVNPEAVLSSETDLTEDNLDNAQVIITLKDAGFNTRLTVSDFVLNNAPQGLSVNTVSLQNETTALLTLDYSGTGFEQDIADFNIMVLASGNNSGNDLTTNNITIFASTTGLHLLKQVENVTLYPNPNDGIFELNLVLKEADKFTIKLIDETGRVAFSKKYQGKTGINIVKFDFSSISQGVKYLQLQINDEQTYIPFIKH